MFTIRPATPEDTGALANLHFASVMNSYGDVLPPEMMGLPLKQNIIAFWKALAATGDIVLLCEDRRDDGPVGFIAMSPDRDAEITEIHVTAAHRDTRIGTGILLAGLKTLEQRGATSAHAYVPADLSRALSFFSQSGGLSKGIAASRSCYGEIIRAQRFEWMDLADHLAKDRTAQ